jgi:hypothetical protein
MLLLVAPLKLEVVLLIHCCRCLPCCGMAARQDDQSISKMHLKDHEPGSERNEKSLTHKQR